MSSKSKMSILFTFLAIICVCQARSDDSDDIKTKSNMPPFDNVMGACIIISLLLTLFICGGFICFGGYLEYKRSEIEQQIQSHTDALTKQKEALAEARNQHLELEQTRSKYKQMKHACEALSKASREFKPMKKTS